MKGYLKITGNLLEFRIDKVLSKSDAILSVKLFYQCAHEIEMSLPSMHKESLDDQFIKRPKCSLVLLKVYSSTFSFFLII